jgi:hypothetical protein
MKMFGRLFFVVGVLVFGIVSSGKPVHAGAVEKISFISFTDENGTPYLVDLFKVSDIAPWDLGSVAMATPNDSYDNSYPSPEWAINFNRDNGTIFGPLLWPFDVPPDDGTYEYAFHDNAGTPLTDSPISIVFAARQLIPPAAESLTTASLTGDELYIDTTTPTFGWAPADSDTSLNYRVVVAPYNGDAVVWASALLEYPATMSVTVPEGVLEADNAYRWAVEVYDAASLAAAGNGARSQVTAFYTGAAGQPLAVTETISRSRVRSSSYDTQFGVVVSGAAPWDISIEIVGSAGYSTVMDGNHFDGDGYWSSHSTATSAENLLDETFTFTIADNRDGAAPASINQNNTFEPNWDIVPHDDDSMFQVNDGGYDLHNDADLFLGCAERRYRLSPAASQLCCRLVLSQHRPACLDK